MVALLTAAAPPGLGSKSPPPRNERGPPTTGSVPPSEGQQACRGPGFRCGVGMLRQHRSCEPFMLLLACPLRASAATFAPPMATSFFLPDDTGSTKRPDVISVLGLLTFINTGISILMYLVMLLAFTMAGQMPEGEFITLFMDAAKQYLSGDDLDRMEGLVRIFHAHGVAIMGIYLVRTVGRLVGAIGMWRGRKMGFYVYATAQLVGLFAPHLFLPWEMLGVFGPLLAVGMTAAYGSQLKRMS